MKSVATNFFQTKHLQKIREFVAIFLFNILFFFKKSLISTFAVLLKLQNEKIYYSPIIFYILIHFHFFLFTICQEQLCRFSFYGWIPLGLCETFQTSKPQQNCPRRRSCQINETFLSKQNFPESLRNRERTLSGSSWDYQ